MLFHSNHIIQATLLHIKRLIVSYLFSLVLLCCTCIYAVFFFSFLFAHRGFNFCLLLLTWKGSIMSTYDCTGAPSELTQLALFVRWKCAIWEWKRERERNKWAWFSSPSSSSTSFCWLARFGSSHAHGFNGENKGGEQSRLVLEIAAKGAQTTHSTYGSRGNAM